MTIPPRFRFRRYDVLPWIVIFIIVLLVLAFLSWLGWDRWTDLEAT